MPEGKELNLKELEQVNGGGMYKYKSKIVWLFTKDAAVKVNLLDWTLVDGKVTKRGCEYIGNSYYFDFYYIECQSNSSVNGWYSASDFEGNVTHIAKKDKEGNIEVINW